MMAFFNKPAETKQFQKFTPQQQGALNQLLTRGLSGVQNQQPLNFEPIAQQARTQFKTQTIPGIAERFESLGSNRGSSGLIGSLGAAGAGLEQGLAALQSQYGLQSRNIENQQLQSLLGLGLQPQFENVYFAEEPGFLETAGGKIGSSILQFLPILLGGLLGGPAGAAAGGAAGSGLSALLSSLGSR